MINTKISKNLYPMRGLLFNEFTNCKKFYDEIYLEDYKFDMPTFINCYLEIYCHYQDEHEVLLKGTPSVCKCLKINKKIMELKVFERQIEKYMSLGLDVLLELFERFLNARTTAYRHLDNGFDSLMKSLKHKSIIVVMQKILRQIFLLVTDYYQKIILNSITKLFKTNEKNILSASFNKVKHFHELLGKTRSQQILQPVLIQYIEKTSELLEFPFLSTSMIIKIAEEIVDYFQKNFSSCEIDELKLKLFSKIDCHSTAIINHAVHNIENQSTAKFVYEMIKSFKMEDQFLTEIYNLSEEKVKKNSEISDKTNEFDRMLEIVHELIFQKNRFGLSEKDLQNLFATMKKLHRDYPFEKNFVSNIPQILKGKNLQKINSLILFSKMIQVDNEDLFEMIRMLKERLFHNPHDIEIEKTFADSLDLKNYGDYKSRARLLMDDVKRTINIYKTEDLSISKFKKIADLCDFSDKGMVYVSPPHINDLNADFSRLSIDFYEKCPISNLYSRFHIAEMNKDQYNNTKTHMNILPICQSRFFSSQTWDLSSEKINLPHDLKLIEDTITERYTSYYRKRKTSYNHRLSSAIIELNGSTLEISTIMYCILSLLQKAKIMEISELNRLLNYNCENDLKKLISAGLVLTHKKEYRINHKYNGGDVNIFEVQKLPWNNTRRLGNFAGSHIMNESIMMKSKIMTIMKRRKNLSVRVLTSMLKGIGDISIALKELCESEFVEIRNNIVVYRP
ncbi:hypothetical protein EDEG_02400 [Edhazardia aedis USNM 41457]|uniref:Cullin family profile domain-containing protein n=1 Tax=Edhazardia aedis (strain USNM 41457) TaxID=1003232 RepID=J9DPG1_EDHAE|nr:hypothetical protein EDEG_02400 [Edhazardia aedis USNM 41457]|eukprot:EJW03232.1 hypothetical protein EDEG_02400 [Edhazardia aedis USNM 41457]